MSQGMNNSEMEAENTNPAPIEVIGPVVEESKKEEVNGHRCVCW